MAKLLVGRRHIVAERVVDNPVKPPNRRGDAESFRAARISTKMMTAWGQHQFRAAFGADMRKSWSVVVDHVHTQASPRDAERVPKQRGIRLRRSGLSRRMY